jgi:hypothetical protein
MKKITIIAWLMVVALTPAQVFAGNAADGSVLGAMGGAALGQAIGRDTEGTLIGAALGSIFGYMVGSESERSVHRVSTVVTPSYPQQVYPNQAWADNGYYRDGECRDSEVLAEIDGYPEKIHVTSCFVNGKWVVQDYNQASIRPSNIIVRDRYYAPALPTTVIINKTVVRRPAVRRVVVEKRHHPKWHKKAQRHNNKHRQYAKHTRHDRDRYDRGRDHRYERRERW